MIDLSELARFSAEIGKDSLLIQSAGGNTSIKDGNVMWIKASGTLLADALERDIFVPVDIEAMREALAKDPIIADQAQNFKLKSESTLRPSIETSLHAVFAQKVVIHVHCVNTIAVAVCKDFPKVLATKLEKFNWCHVDYARPGAQLAVSVSRALKPETDVAVLGNHGLIVAADTVADASKLLYEVVSTLTVSPDNNQQVSIQELTKHITDGWMVPDEENSMHQLALGSTRLNQATSGSLYPDHVIFCGVAVKSVDINSIPNATEAPPFILVPEKGAILKTDATDGAIALANCLGDVLLRVATDAQLHYLTDQENDELLNWDAEKYRQKLNVN